MITICAKKGCTARSVAGSDRCIHHQPMPGMGLFTVWFIFVAFVTLALLVGAGWAVFELVTWVTS